MMHTYWNTSSNPASRGVRSRSLFVILTLVVLGYPTGYVVADEEVAPLLFTSTTRTPKDIAIETKVRRALRQDAQLRPLNLGVHMSGGIAKLSGPVPSAELKQRAVSIVKRVDGVRDVNAKDLYLSTADQGGKQVAVLIQEDRPTQTLSASPGSPALIGEKSGTSTQSQQVTLLAPEMTAPVARVQEEARLTANPHPAGSTVSIAAAIENVRRREARYQQIRTQVQGTTVYVFPSGTAGEDAMTFAQAVRRLPGVQHVIVESASH